MTGSPPQAATERGLPPPPDAIREGDHEEGRHRAEAHPAEQAADLGLGHLEGLGDDIRLYVRAGDRFAGMVDHHEQLERDRIGPVDTGNEPRMLHTQLEQGADRPVHVEPKPIAGGDLGQII